MMERRWRTMRGMHQTGCRDEAKEWYATELVDYLNALERRLAEAEAALEQARFALSVVEWVADRNDDWIEPTCPDCGNAESEGHDGCRLEAGLTAARAALAALTSAAPSAGSGHAVSGSGPSSDSEASSR